MPIRAVLLDLDGTVYALEQPIPGADRALADVRARGITLRFLTNIDSQPPDAVAAKVRGFDVDVHEGEVFTPVVAALQLLEAAPRRAAYPLVSEVLLPSFARYDTGPPYDMVVVGDCRDRLTYGVLDEAFRALRSGAELIALQCGRYFKRADGDHLDTGAAVAALEYAAGTTARLLGKPDPGFFQLALDHLHATAADTLVVGDDVFADIAGGKQAGMRTALVRTGKYRDAADQRDSIAPDHIIDSIADLPRLLDKLP